MGPVVATFYLTNFLATDRSRRGDHFLNAYNFWLEQREQDVYWHPAGAPQEPAGFVSALHV